MFIPPKNSPPRIATAQEAQAVLQQFALGASQPKTPQVTLAKLGSTSPRFILKRPFAAPDQFKQQNLVLRSMGFVFDRDTKEWFCENEQTATQAAKIVGGSFLAVNGAQATVGGGAGGPADRPNNVREATPDNQNAQHGTGSQGFESDDEADDDREADIEADGEGQDGDEAEGDDTQDPSDEAASDAPDMDESPEASTPSLESLTARQLGMVAKVLTRRGKGIGNYALANDEEKAAGMSSVKDRMISRIKKAVPDSDELASLIETALRLGDESNAQGQGKGQNSKGSQDGPSTKSAPQGQGNAPISADGDESGDEQDQGDDQTDDDSLSHEADEDETDMTPAPQAKPQTDDDSLEDEFSKRQAKAIREAIENAENTLDEDRVREIAQEEAKRGDVAILETVSQTLDQMAQALQTELDARLTAHEAAQTTAGAGNVLSLQPRAITVTMNGITRNVSGTPHYIASKVAALIMAGQHTFLFGPPGTGKTTLIESVAEMTGRPSFGYLALTGGVTEGAIQGKGVPLGDGRYFTSQFVKAFGGTDEHPDGGLIMLDELCAGDPNTLMAFQMALGNKRMVIEARTMGGLSPEVAQASKFGLVAGDNTSGGGDTEAYTSRNQLDAALQDRLYAMAMDYDFAIVASMFGASEIDASLVKPLWEPSQEPFTQNERNAWFGWALQVKDALQNSRSKKVWSPRMGLRITAARSVGVSRAECLADNFSSWKTEEPKKLLGALADGPQFSD